MRHRHRGSSFRRSTRPEDRTANRSRVGGWDGVSWVRGLPAAEGGAHRLDMLGKEVELPEEVVLLTPFGALKKAGEVRHQAMPAPPLLEVGQSGQVDRQWGRQ